VSGWKKKRVGKKKKKSHGVVRQKWGGPLWHSDGSKKSRREGQGNFTRDKKNAANQQGRMRVREKKEGKRAKKKIG